MKRYIATMRIQGYIRGFLVRSDSNRTGFLGEGQIRILELTTSRRN